MLKHFGLAARSLFGVLEAPILGIWTHKSSSGTRAYKDVLKGRRFWPQAKNSAACGSGLSVLELAKAGSLQPAV